MSNIDSLGSFDIKVDRSAMPREDNLHTVDINVPARMFDIELHPAPHDDGGLMEEVERLIRSKFYVSPAFLYRTFASEDLCVLSLTTKGPYRFEKKFEIFVSGHDCMDSEDEDPLYEDDEDTGVSEVLIRVHRHCCTTALGSTGIAELCTFLEVDPSEPHAQIFFCVRSESMYPDLEDNLAYSPTEMGKFVFRNCDSSGMASISCRVYQDDDFKLFEGLVASIVRCIMSMSPGDGPGYMFWHEKGVK